MKNQLQSRSHRCKKRRSRGFGEEMTRNRKKNMWLRQERKPLKSRTQIFCYTSVDCLHKQQSVVFRSEIRLKGNILCPWPQTTPPLWGRPTPHQQPLIPPKRTPHIPLSELCPFHMPVVHSMAPESQPKSNGWGCPWKKGLKLPVSFKSLNNFLTLQKPCPRYWCSFVKGKMHRGKAAATTSKPISGRQLRSEADTSKAPKVVEILLESISPSPFLAQPSQRRFPSS